MFEPVTSARNSEIAISRKAWSDSGMDWIMILLALAFLAMFVVATLAMAWASGVCGAVAFAACGMAAYISTGGGRGPVRPRHDPRLNAFQQALSRKR